MKRTYVLGMQAVSSNVLYGSSPNLRGQKYLLKLEAALREIQVEGEAVLFFKILEDQEIQLEQAQRSPKTQELLLAGRDFVNRNGSSVEHNFFLSRSLPLVKDPIVFAKTIDSLITADFMDGNGSAVSHLDRLIDDTDLQYRSVDTLVRAKSEKVDHYLKLSSQASNTHVTICDKEYKRVSEALAGANVLGSPRTICDTCQGKADTGFEIKQHRESFDEVKERYLKGIQESGVASKLISRYLEQDGRGTLDWQNTYNVVVWEAVHRQLCESIKSSLSSSSGGSLPFDKVDFRTIYRELMDYGIYNCDAPKLPAACV